MRKYLALASLAIIISLCVNNVDAKNSSHINREVLEFVAKNYENITRLEDVLDIYNINTIGLNWINVSGHLGKSCAYNMMEYLNGLQERKIWAMKSE
jgi:hypothetical protein